MWLQALGLLIGAIGVSVVVSTVVISIDSLKNDVKNEYPDAFKMLAMPDLNATCRFKMLIKEKKKDAVKVGIFDKTNSHIEDIEITSNKGVSNNLHQGQTIYI